MKKFLNHKNRIINSKRDSQKIDQLQLMQFSQVHSQAHINSRVVEVLRQQLHSITHQHYKIGVASNQAERRAKTVEVRAVGRFQDRLDSRELDPLESIRSTLSQVEQMDQRGSCGSSKRLDKSESDILSRIINLMISINLLQQKRSAELNSNSPLTKHINQQLQQFKELVTLIDGRSRSKVLDFYNEQVQSHSPSSFNSRKSQQLINQNSDRQAYQMTDTRQGEIQIKYRRIDRLQSTEQDDNEDTFMDDEEYQLDQTPEQEVQFFENRSINDSNIVHLFSYDKEKQIQSVLSSITQRSSQYHSPDSKNMNSKELSDQNLQFKKIQYLLETSGKKKQISTTSRHQISQFVPQNKTNRSNISLAAEAKDRSRCHLQLMGMINHLQTKYHRKVGSENVMDSINATLSSRMIRPRGKK